MYEAEADGVTTVTDPAVNQPVETTKYIKSELSSLSILEDTNIIKIEPYVAPSCKFT